MRRTIRIVDDLPTEHFDIPINHTRKLLQWLGIVPTPGSFTGFPLVHVGCERRTVSEHYLNVEQPFLEFKSEDHENGTYVFECERCREGWMLTREMLEDAGCNTKAILA